MSEIPNYELKAIACEFKELDESGYFEGKAAVMGNIDSYRDIIMSGAFQKTISERGSKVPVLAEHKDTIGSGEVFDAGTYLGIRGRILMSVQKGREYVELAKAGVVRGLSIGYKTIKEEYDATRKVRLLKELKLYEVSLVTFPANELATVSTAKRTPGHQATTCTTLEALRIIREDEQEKASANPLAQALRELRQERRM